MALASCNKWGAYPSNLKEGFWGRKCTTGDELQDASMEKFAGNGQRITAKSDEGALKIIDMARYRLFLIPANIGIYLKKTVD
jgi:hypothetical protein